MLLNREILELKRSVNSKLKDYDLYAPYWFHAIFIFAWLCGGKLFCVMEDFFWFENGISLEVLNQL